MNGDIILLALTCEFAMIPITRPSIQLDREDITVTNVKVKKLMFAILIPLTKISAKFMITVIMNGGIKLPKKNSSPLTEEVMSARSVCFSFSSAKGRDVIMTAPIPILKDKPRFSAMPSNMSILDESPSAKEV